LVFARDRRYLDSKILELTEIGAPFLIICGEPVDDPRVLYRSPAGKWDALNFGCGKVDNRFDVIIMNDVDTTIHNLDYALRLIEAGADIVYCKVCPKHGPQIRFYRLLDLLRRGGLHIAASGELMIVRKKVLERLLPIPPCLAEDTYLIFRALEFGYRVRFCEETFTSTERTENAEQEAKYKARTTLGIYQALLHSRPPLVIRAFYAGLPLLSLLLFLGGRDGRAWMAGIHAGLRSLLAGHNISQF